MALDGLFAMDDLETAIRSRLMTPETAPERAWAIASRSGVGRYLIAARDLAANEIVFSEAPLIVAMPLPNDSERAIRGEMAAVALELLREPETSPARLLCEADFSADTDGSLAGSMRVWTLGVLRALKSRPPILRADGSVATCDEDAVSWALSVASVNVHGQADPERGVLGLLASMMEHDCAPSCSTHVASDDVFTLRTRRSVRAGERLSITYVAMDTPLRERRRQLRLQHGFVCACARCAAELAAADGGTPGESDWRHAWENRVWSGLDPYTGSAEG